MGQQILDIEYASGLMLDMYLPEIKGFKSIVYFHGGGINSGDKHNDEAPRFAKAFNEKGYAFITCNYTLYPNTRFPLFIEEAAKAVKFVLDNIEKYGGDKNNVYVSGQSAGAWITMMLCCDKHYLTDIGVNLLNIKGWISDSAQVTSHFNVITYEDGLNALCQRIDNKAPLFFIDENFKSSPILLIYYQQDMPNRPQQNELFYSTVKNFNLGIDIEKIILPGGHCHGSCIMNQDGSYDYVLTSIEWLERH